MKAAKVEALRESISVETGTLQKAYKDPIILVSGNLNHKDFG